MAFLSTKQWSAVNRYFRFKGALMSVPAKKHELPSVLLVSPFGLILDLKDKRLAVMAAAVTSPCCSLERVCQIKHCEGTHQCTQPWRPAVG